MFRALFFLLLLPLGVLLFSVVSGFCIYPAVQRAAFERLALSSKGKGDDGNVARIKERLKETRRLFVSRKVRLKRGRRSLSGWLFLPASQRMSPKRILLFAPEGRSFSLEDLAFFLDAGFLEYGGGSSSPPAVFLPMPAEPFRAGKFFSFGAREAAALSKWARLFALAFPSASVLFCGKGLGGISALLAATRLSRHAAGKRRGFGGVIVASPCLSAARLMKGIVRELFPRRALYVPVYAGVRIASVFRGLGLGGRGCRRALKRLLAIKKRESGIVVECLPCPKAKSQELTARS